MKITESKPSDLDSFFDYLDKQLLDNAAPQTPIFQPLSSQQSQVSNRLRNKFKIGLTSSFGTPSWRPLWLAKAQDKMVWTRFVVILTYAIMMMSIAIIGYFWGWA